MPPTPLSASLGNAGRAGYSSAEFHILNPATLLYGGTYQISSMYHYNQGQKYYGLSMTNTKNIPIGVTWIKKRDQNMSVFSVAGKLSKNIFLGVGVYTPFQEEDFIPQLGILYIPSKILSLGFTGKRMDQDMYYGWGSRWSYFPQLVVYLDTLYEKKEFIFQGGVEFITKNKFSVRLGSSWPVSTLNLGISFNAFPLKIDYTWIQKSEHIFGVRIQSAS